MIETEIIQELAAAVASGLSPAEEFDRTLNARLSGVRRAATNGLLDTGPEELLERVGTDISSDLPGLNLDEQSRSIAGERARAILDSRAAAQELTEVSLENDFATQLYRAEDEGRLTAAMVGMCVEKCDQETVEILAARNDGRVGAPGGVSVEGEVAGVLGGDFDANILEIQFGNSPQENDLPIMTETVPAERFGGANGVRRLAEASGTNLTIDGDGNISLLSPGGDAIPLSEAALRYLELVGQSREALAEGIESKQLFGRLIGLDGGRIGVVDEIGRSRVLTLREKEALGLFKSDVMVPGRSGVQDFEAIFGPQDRGEIPTQRLGDLIGSENVTEFVDTVRGNFGEGATGPVGLTGLALIERAGGDFRNLFTDAPDGIDGRAAGGQVATREVLGQLQAEAESEGLQRIEYFNFFSQREQRVVTLGMYFRFSNGDPLIEAFNDMSRASFAAMSMTPDGQFILDNLFERQETLIEELNRRGFRDSEFSPRPFIKITSAIEGVDDQLDEKLARSNATDSSITVENGRRFNNDLTITMSTATLTGPTNRVASARSLENTIASAPADEFFRQNDRDFDVDPSFLLPFAATIMHEAFHGTTPVFSGLSATAEALNVTEDKVDVEQLAVGAEGRYIQQISEFLGLDFPSRIGHNAGRFTFNERQFDEFESTLESRLNRQPPETRENRDQAFRALRSLGLTDAMIGLMFFGVEFDAENFR